jgi:hypothetical protein
VTVSAAARTTARRVAFEAKTLVARYPAIAIPVARRRHGEPVGDDTEIVIEGFPRSGTSFAVAAFRRAQRRAVAIACHVHAPAQLVEGVRRGLPSLLIVREPEAACVSFAIRNPHLSLRQAIRAYVRFHEPLVPLRDRLTVARFEDVTSDLGAVIDGLNARSRTTFVTFEHTPEAVDAVFAEIDEDYGRRLTGESFERAVARPSSHRASLRPRVEAAYRAEHLAPIRARADAVYRRLTRDA